LFVPDVPLAVAKAIPTTFPVTKPWATFVTVIVVALLAYVAETGAVAVSKISSVPAEAVPTVDTALSLVRPNITKPELLRWPDLTSVCIVIINLL
jgi:hypothetical protein